MQVITRNNIKEPIQFDKITDRIQSLCFDLDDLLDPSLITQKVIEGIYDEISTRDLDQLAAETAAYLSPNHPDYNRLAGRIAVSNLHKETDPCLSNNIEKMFHYVNSETNQPAPLISEELYNIVMRNKDKIDAEVSELKDFNYDFFGFKTLERAYLLKMYGKIVERPGQMLMRVSLGIHGEDLDSAFKTYKLMAEQYFTHASPTLFNSGTPRPQLSSCFLVQMKEDSISGIYDTLKTCAQISQSAGGIGVNIHNVRAKGSYISGTNGTSNGIIPMLKVFNDTARYVDQGGGKRKGAFAMYLEPWHADIFDFLELRKNTGKDEQRARDLFYALWVNDLFMERVEKNENWSLFCPHQCPGLSDVHSKEFERLYLQYEKAGRAMKTVPAQELWFKILETQIETGMPFMMYKDSVNRKSNQKNLGTIKSSNLCTEILEYTSPDEVAVCNLASISLKKCVKNGQFSFEQLRDVVYQATVNLNKVIDINYYPVEEAKNSNLKHRPIGLGVQGLAETFFELRIPFDSEEALKLNAQIFETLYYVALTASCDIAKKDGVYSSYEGSPISQGLLQYDLWGVTVDDSLNDWTGLKKKIAKHGVRNSLLVAPMPTASTSQIMGNTESFEPLTSNLYVRRVLSGEFTVINSYLINDLIERGLWNESMKKEIMASGGSIQHIDSIPQELKDLYKTVWEIKQKHIINMSKARAPFIDQGQSLNIHMEAPNFGKLSSMHFYAWKQGLKTGMYYLRSRSAVNAVKFTANQQQEAIACSLENPEECIMCGS